jgi:HAE1 family hydrophobic/amphiphilic exporter-1
VEVVLIAFLTNLALRRRSVTVLAIILVLVSGIYTYNRLPVELFPEVEFPLVTVTTFYPSSNPESVADNVTVPIENAIAGMDGLDALQTISTENQSVIIATFSFGTDMEEAENIVSSRVSGLRFPDGVNDPIVGRIDPDSFPVISISVTGEREIVELQRILETSVLPRLSGIDGISSLEVAGDVQQQVLITVDPDQLLQRGVSLFQVSQALRENNITFPGGAISSNGQTLPVKTTNVFRSLEELEQLVVGFPRAAPGQQGQQAGPPQPIRLGEVADIQIGASAARSISRTNGKPSISVSVFKGADANTIDVTTAVEEALAGGDILPPGVEVVITYNDGPQIQAQIDTLEREAVLGLTLAVIVVFAFFLTVRPSALRGVFRTLRPTLVIALTIPLSIFTGVLLMNWQGLSLNFMTLGGLAISVGRVVDDSIVVLENIYRNIETGKDRWRAALAATVEVGPAITASTLATIVVFAPLAFIQGLVGAFFFPFALAVSFALIASLLVALTAVPVLGAYLLRPGDLPEGTGEEEDIPETNTWMQRIYVPMLRWSLGHKSLALIAAIIIAGSSFGLLRFIPINLFSSGGTQFVTINMVLPPGTPADFTLAEVFEIERQIEDVSDLYETTVGATTAGGGQSFASGLNQSTTFIRVKEDAPEDIIQLLRERLPSSEERRITIDDIGGGPPAAGLEISITGSDYRDIAPIALLLASELETIDGIEDISSDVNEARDEVIIDVDPERAAALGLSTQTVAFQINQFLVGQRVTQLELEDGPVNVFLSGPVGSVNSVETISALLIAGPLGVAPLGEIATVGIEAGPVAIRRTDRLRSASISGDITADDTQAVGLLIQEKIDALDLPPGVTVTNAGIFTQITEGFEDIFIAMAVGIISVYLVMVGSLGSLRNPFVIVTSLPLALIGALAALAITGRSLGLPGMMGILLLIGIVVTNAVVLVTFVEQLRERGMNVYDALMLGGRVRLRPILMTAITTSFALIPLAAFSEDTGGILGSELATVVIGGLVSSTFLTLLVVPVVYTLANESIPGLFRRKPRRQRPTIERVEVTREEFHPAK